ncbi:hypothetical protein D3C81_1458800 [compost metagenome]
MSLTTGITASAYSSLDVDEPATGRSALKPKMSPVRLAASGVKDRLSSRYSAPKATDSGPAGSSIAVPVTFNVTF